MKYKGLIDDGLPKPEAAKKAKLSLGTAEEFGRAPVGFFRRSRRMRGLDALR